MPGLQISRNTISSKEQSRAGLCLRNFRTYESQSRTTKGGELTAQSWAQSFEVVFLVNGTKSLKCVICRVYTVIVAETT